MINKAIDIAKTVLEKDQRQFFIWIEYKYKLAYIYFKNNDLQKSKNILVEIKPLAEKRFSEYPDLYYKNNALIKLINELIEKCSND